MRTTWLLLPLMLVSASPALADIASAERARIAQERQQVEARFAAESADCRQRFVVTPCLEALQSRRRDALAVLREQELMLEDVDRKRRAAAKLQALEAKRLSAASRPPAPPEVMLRQPPLAASSVAGSPPPPAPAASAADAARASRRALASEQRRLRAEAERQRITRREAERSASGKAAAPLPLPPELAGSAQAR